MDTEKYLLEEILKNLKDEVGKGVSRDNQIISIYRYLFDEKDRLVKYNKTQDLLGVYIPGLNIIIDNNLGIIEVDACFEIKNVDKDEYYTKNQCDRTERKIKQMGIGLLFVKNNTRKSDEADEKEFIDILTKFNCPEKVARDILNDLDLNSKRQTTTQYHIKNDIPEINKLLKPLDIKVEKTLPKLKTSARQLNKKDLGDAIKQLEKQYSKKNFGK